MAPLYAGSPLAAALYYLVIAAWLASEAFVFVRHVTVAGDRRQDRLSGPALLGSLLVAVWLGTYMARAQPSAAITSARQLVFGLGLLLAVGGIATRWYAITTLGRFFTMRVITTADQTVVETGPYKLVRHPSYTGALLTVLGVLLCSTNWVTLACFVLALPGFAYRIRVEEQALVGALGEPYAAYMRRTKRLVPYLI